MDENNLNVFASKKHQWLTLNSLGDLKVVKILNLGNVTLNDKEILARFKVKGDNVGPNGNGFYFTMSGKEISVSRSSLKFLSIRIQELEAAESMATDINSVVYVFVAATAFSEPA